MSAELKEFTKADVKAHNQSNDCWIIYKNEVFDVTKFLASHPGGEETILEQGGSDATSAFNDIGHSAYAKEQLQTYKIGTIKKVCKYTVMSHL